MSVIGLMIEALFFSDLWIFLYNILLQNLNILLPVPIPKEIIFTAAPEPYEIPLYLVISAGMVFLIWLLHTYVIKEAVSKIRQPVIKFAVLVILGLLFVINIGPYPMAHDTFPYSPLLSVFTFRLSYLLYLVVAAGIIVVSTMFSTYIAKNKKLLTVLFGLILFFIAFVTFEPQFPITPHDYSFFFGPVWEVLHGKTIFTQIPSQYGFLSILFFAFLHKVQLFNIAYLPALVWTFYIIQYFLCFYLIYRISRSTMLGIIGLLSIITVNYYSIYHFPASYPQIGPVRWLPLILSLFLLVKFRSIISKKLIFVVVLLSFWEVDSGIALALAYCLTLFFLTFSKQIKNKEFAIALLSFFGSGVIIFIGINLFQLLLGYQTIAFQSVYGKLVSIGKAGSLMLPMESVTYFWIFILMYIASMVYIFRKKTHDLNDQILMFAGNLSLFAGIYFVGRSHPHNLFHIALFPILNAFLLIGLIIKHDYNRKRKIILSIFLFIIFIAYPLYNRQEVMTNMIKEKINRIAAGHIFEPEWPRIIAQKYYKDKVMIDREIKDKKIVILSQDDTFLFYYLNKENLLDDNPRISISAVRDFMDQSLKNVFNTCPHKMLVDCSFFGKCGSEDKTFVGFKVHSIDSQLMARIGEVCKTTYKPAVCSDMLCIAEAQPI